MLIPTGFWSYTTSDDAASRGKLSQLRELLAAELQQQVGRTPKVIIFQDVVAIPPGRQWERQIREAIAKSSFIIPIITPGFLQSEWCCQEVNMFRERSQSLGGDELVFPIHYVDTDHIDENISNACHDISVLTFLRTRQWVDFRDFRFRSQEGEDVGHFLRDLSKAIRSALSDAAEQRRKSDENAARFVENFRRGADAEAKRIIGIRQPQSEAAVAVVVEPMKQISEDEAKRISKKERRQLQAEETHLAENKRRMTEFESDFANEKEQRRMRHDLLKRGLFTNIADRDSEIKEDFTADQERYPTIKEKYQDDAALVHRVNQMQSNAAKEALEIGLKYATGSGFKKDQVKAARYFRVAAERGNTEAQWRLGKIHESGIGVERNRRIAIAWYVKSATQGNIEARKSYQILLMKKYAPILLILASIALCGFYYREIIGYFIILLIRDIGR